MKIIELWWLIAVLQGYGKKCDYSEDVDEKGDNGAQHKINRSMCPRDGTILQED